jgi:isopentenyl-diphosphate delta-isomerase
MTGGTELARKINENIARVCKDFGMGMGLGSCRILMDDDTYFEDFNIRKYIGDSQPLYANLGIAQIDMLLLNNDTDKIKRLIEKLKADGLIIHVNPLQEWFQPEGNLITRPSIDIIEELIEKAEYPLIIKEVGQGMGSKSLKRLLQLPIEAIEFGAFGGANFSMVELLRRDKDESDIYKPLAYVGQTAEQMVDAINHLSGSVDFVCRQLIISGGIKNFLDGYYLMQKSAVPALYGQASTILKYAKKSCEELFRYIEMQVKGLLLAEAFLRINPDYLKPSKIKKSKRAGGFSCPKESLSESPAPVVSPMASECWNV